MGKYNFVDFRAVERAVSILRVLEHYGLLSKLHRNGESLTGACPIHGGDDTTAFRVSLSKNRWNCLSGCQCGGNVLDFVAHMEKVSLLKAAYLLVEWFDLHFESAYKESSDPSSALRLTPAAE